MLTQLQLISIYFLTLIEVLTWHYCPPSPRVLSVSTVDHDLTRHQSFTLFIDHHKTLRAVYVTIFKHLYYIVTKKVRQRCIYRLKLNSALLDNMTSKCSRIIEYPPILAQICTFRKQSNTKFETICSPIMKPATTRVMLSSMPLHSTHSKIFTAPMVSRC